MAKLIAKYKLILKTSVLILIKIQFIDILVWISQSVKSMIKCLSSTKDLFSVPHEHTWRHTNTMNVIRQTLAILFLVSFLLLC